MSRFENWLMDCLLRKKKYIYQFHILFFFVFIKFFIFVFHLETNQYGKIFVNKTTLFTSVKYPLYKTRNNIDI